MDMTFKLMMRSLGFNKEMDRIDKGQCPLCGQEVHLEDFRDELSIKEYHISGLCQSCQDDVFGQ